MKKLIAALLTLCLVLSCAAMAEGLTVGYTVQSMENAYFVSIVEGMKAAAKDRGINLIVADAAADASKHINHIDDFVAQGVGNAQGKLTQNSAYGVGDHSRQGVRTVKLFYVRIGDIHLGEEGLIQKLLSGIYAKIRRDSD